MGGMAGRLAKARGLAMLIPRVTSALVKLLSPVASTANNALDMGRNAVRDLRDKKGSKKGGSPPKQDPPEQEGGLGGSPKEKPRLTLVQGGAQEDLDAQDPPPAEDPSPPSIFSDPTKPSAVVQLFSLFQKKSQAKTSSSGGSYKTAIKEQKRAGTFKKGAIVDTKVE